MNHTHTHKRPLKDFLPLIILFTLIGAFTIAHQLYEGFNLTNAMSDFMAGFFIVFGSFKLMRWHGFAQAYSTYDILAQRSMAYAYAYPLIEIGLGIVYLLRIFPVAANIITIIVMAISSIGVIKALMNKRDIECACLGTVFKIPMTIVTLMEDVIMLAMALIMLIMR